MVRGWVGSGLARCKPICASKGWGIQSVLQWKMRLVLCTHLQLNINTLPMQIKLYRGSQYLLFTCWSWISPQNKDPISGLTFPVCIQTIHYKNAMFAFKTRMTLARQKQMVKSINYTESVDFIIYFIHFPSSNKKYTLISPLPSVSSHFRLRHCLCFYFRIHCAVI